MSRLFQVEARRIWGDIGAILTAGWFEDHQNGKIQLMRTGPFVPPISFPPGTCVVTDDFRKQLEVSGLSGIAEYRAVIKHKIVTVVNWERWTLTDDLSASQLRRLAPEYLHMNEPEDLVIRRRHSPRTATQIGDLWEIVAHSGTNIDFVRPAHGALLVSSEAKQWLKAHVGDWVSFPGDHDAASHSLRIVR
jgi:hypothetical protein